MITATNLSMRFGGKILFKQSHFQLNPGCHYGLIGANGAGKSTLLKILSQDITPEEGKVSIPSQYTIGTLKQDHFLYETVAIIDVVLMGNAPLWQAWQAKERLLEKIEFVEEDCFQLEELEKIIENHQGYSAASKAGAILEGLGLPTSSHHHTLNTLSGGYKLRVLLAQLLFSKPAILLLDEPTNHLDLYSIKWLEDYLKQFPGTILLSSHDRDFLNHVCNYILDLDYQKIIIYKGNYTEFLKTKAALQEQKEGLIAKNEKRREDLQEFIDRFKATASKAKQAQSKMKLVEKLEDEITEFETAPSSRKYPRLSFEPHRSSGAVVLKVKDIHKSYGNKQVLSHISFEVERGDRLALVGANGIGKSTLLEILTEHLLLDKGTWEWGYATDIAYFPQDHLREIQGKPSLLEWLSAQDPIIPEQKVRELLGRLLFTGEDAKKPASILSGGETARLILAKMMLIKNNVLIFDEPTNHLDMESIEALLEALHSYKGTIIFVSHNRHFVSHLANRIIELTDKGVKDYRCSYLEYIEKREMDLLAYRSKSANKTTPLPQQLKKPALNNLPSKFQQKKAIEQIEKKIYQIEEKIKELEQQMAVENFYANLPLKEIQKLTLHQKELKKQWEEAMQELDQVLSS